MGKVGGRGSDPPGLSTGRSTYFSPDYLLFFFFFLPFEYGIVSPRV